MRLFFRPALYSLSLFYSTFDENKQLIKSFCEQNCESKAELLKKKLSSEIKLFKNEHGIPGIVCAVSIDGRTVYKEGKGFCEIETFSKCQNDSVFKVGSITRLVDQSKLTYNSSIYKYIGDAIKNKKTFGKEIPDITIEQLLANTSGFRHYKTNNYLQIDDEYLLQTHYKTLSEAISLFWDDELVAKPGSSYVYSTHGFTILGAILEKVTQKSFTSLLKEFSDDLALVHTVTDGHHHLIRGRVGNYMFNENRKITNAPYSDDSWKFPGGGCLSCCDDLLKVGNELLYCFHNNDGYIRKETLRNMWTEKIPTDGTRGSNYHYGLGFAVEYREKYENWKYARNIEKIIFHSGLATADSSFWMIVPTSKEKIINDVQHFPENKDFNKKIDGIVIVILCNMRNIHMRHLGIRLLKHTLDAIEVIPIEDFDNLS